MKDLYIERHEELISDFESHHGRWPTRDEEDKLFEQAMTGIHEDLMDKADMLRKEARENEH